MKPLGDPKRHIQLLNGMAKALDVDLVDATRNGVLDQPGYATLVTRCRGCENPDDCTSRLRSADGVSEAPSYCRNADLLKKLAV